jgi:hypothetical protein
MRIETEALAGLVLQLEASLGIFVHDGQGQPAARRTEACRKRGDRDTISAKQI